MSEVDKIIEAFRFIAILMICGYVLVKIAETFGYL